MARNLVFINPPCHSPMPYYPLGIGYLYEIVRAQGVDATLLDIQSMIIKGELKFDSSLLSNVKELLCLNHASIFALSIMNSSYPWAQELVKIIKAVYPDSKIIVGGPHATLLKEQILEENSLVDVSVVFEGEKIIYPLTQALLADDRKVLLEIKNLYVRTNENSVVFTGEESFMDDLDKLPYINDENYFSNSVLSFEVGRGCPYSCYFCSTNYVWKKKPRFKSARRIVDEALFYYNKIKHFKNPLIMFEHDNFLTRKEVLREIAALKQESQTGFAYGCDCRIDLLDDEIIELLEKSGCNYIFFGIESGSPRIQEISKKKVALENVLPTLTKLIERRFCVETNYIVGFPEETLEEALQTLELAAAVKWLCPPLSNVNINIMTPLPCSPLSLQVDDEDFVLLTESDYYKQMKDAGLEPGSYNKRSTNHLYVINNKQFDIGLMARFVPFYYDALRYYPISLFILVKLFNQSFFLIYSIFREHMDDIRKAGSFDKQFGRFISCLDIPEPAGAGSLYNDIFNYESVRMLYSNGHAMEPRYLFKYDIQNIYKECKYNPAILLEKPEYPEKSTVINFSR